MSSHPNPSGSAHPPAPPSHTKLPPLTMVRPLSTASPKVSSSIRPTDLADIGVRVTGSAGVAAVSLDDDDMDKSDMQRTVESLRHQLNIERKPISQSAAELRRFTECQQDQDPLVNPVDKRVNPWAEKSKCDIL